MDTQTAYIHILEKNPGATQGKNGAKKKKKKEKSMTYFYHQTSKL